MTKKYFFLSLLFFSFVASPFSLRAESDNTASLIASLRQQIAVLQAQITKLQGQKVIQSCYNFDKNFGVGANGKQVLALQTVLAKEGLMPAPGPVPVPMMSRDSDNHQSDDKKDKNKQEDREDGSNSQGNAYGNYRFTEMMAATVSAFQVKYRSEILTPFGLANPTGYVGPSTRAKLNQLYGCGNVVPPVPGNLPPTISSISGPTTLNVGQTATWMVQASDPENGTLSYSVIWGDEAVTASGAVASPSSASVQQTATFTHSYAQVGTYYPTFTVTDNTGQRNQTRLSVVVSQISSNPTP